MKKKEDKHSFVPILCFFTIAEVIRAQKRQTKTRRDVVLPFPHQSPQSRARNVKVFDYASKQKADRALHRVNKQSKYNRGENTNFRSKALNEKNCVRKRKTN